MTSPILNRIPTWSVSADEDSFAEPVRAKHTCTPDGRPLPFGRKQAGCPRCDELLAGAAPAISLDASMCLPELPPVRFPRDNDQNYAFASGADGDHRGVSSGVGGCALDRVLDLTVLIMELSRR
jgi:hypothetical protein